MAQFRRRLSAGVKIADLTGVGSRHRTTGRSARARTATLVLMLQAAEVGGGLRIFEATYRNAHEPTNGDLATPHRTLAYRAGDALLMESTRLHQIRPFRGSRDRISATLHAVEVDSGVWETWF